MNGSKPARHNLEFDEENDNGLDYALEACEDIQDDKSCVARAAISKCDPCVCYAESMAER